MGCLDRSMIMFNCAYRKVSRFLFTIFYASYKTSTIGGYKIWQFFQKHEFLGNFGRYSYNTSHPLSLEMPIVGAALLLADSVCFLR